MFIINVRFVCYLEFESDNILGKEKLHFCTKTEFFNTHAFDTLHPNDVLHQPFPISSHPLMR